jgi:hypothetical protein
MTDAVSLFSTVFFVSLLSFISISFSCKVMYLMSPFLFTGEVAVHQQGYAEKDRICEDPCSLQEKTGTSASFVHGFTFGVGLFAAAEEVSVSLIH